MAAQQLKWGDHYCHKDLSSGSINREPWEPWIIVKKKNGANLFSEINGGIINRWREDLLLVLEEKSKGK